jgi:hypothetical protein
MRMKTDQTSVAVLCEIICLAALAAWLPWNVQGAPPLDYHAVFKTHVPHTRSSNGGGNRNGGPGGGGGGGSPTATFNGSPYTVGATMTPTTSHPEAEEHIAVAPTPQAAGNFVAAISDFSLRGGYNTTKYVVSYINVNNELSWLENYVPLDGNDYPVTSDGNAWEANSDPVVAIDKLGNDYLANLYFNGSDNKNGLYVSVGNLGNAIDFAATTTYPVAANLDPNTTTDEDKEWIAVDNSDSAYHGTVYVSWTRFVGNADMILVSRSVNRGQTWFTPVQINPGNQNGAVQGSQVAVGPAGEVYVVYEVFFVGGVRQHWLAKSTDGGQSFSSAVAITPGFNELSFNSTYRKNSFASLAVNPVNGDVYVVYADQPSGSSQVEFIKSGDGGNTFSSPVAVNDSSSGQRLMPAVTADNAGNIHASWFDTRNSGSSTASYDIYATYSADGGAAFGHNARVTPQQVYAGSASFIGDYAGIAGVDGAALPVWTSGGFNNGFLQSAVLTMPAPPPSPGSITVNGITPSTINKGASETVTISGTGFQNGAVVTFENGSGQTPTVSGVSFVDSMTIKATVSTSTKGKPGSIWDVRVTNPDGGTAVLANAFTVN